MKFLWTVSFLSTPGPSQPHPQIGALHPSSSPLLTSSHAQTARVSLSTELSFSFLRQRASSHVLNSLLTYITELRPCSKRFLLFDPSPLCTVSSQTLCSVPTQHMPECRSKQLLPICPPNTHYFHSKGRLYFFQITASLVKALYF